MVGPWPLAPHHDPLQYIHHIHLMQRGQNQDITPQSASTALSIGLQCAFEVALLSCPIYAKAQGKIPP